MNNENVTFLFCCVHKVVVSELVWEFKAWVCLLLSIPLTCSEIIFLNLYLAFVWNGCWGWHACVYMCVYGWAWGRGWHTVTACGDGICGVWLCYPCVPVLLTSDNDAAPSPLCRKTCILFSIATLLKFFWVFVLTVRNDFSTIFAMLSMA